MAALRYAVTASEISVVGESMVPSVLPGARVSVRVVRLPLPGDIVVFRSRDGRNVIHRMLGMVWRDGLQLITCGDNAPTVDALVAVDMVVGVVDRLDGVGLRTSTRCRVNAAARGALVIMERVVSRWRRWVRP